MQLASIKMMYLSELKLGQKGVVEWVNQGPSSLRIMELGIVRGVEITLSSIAPTGNPLAFQLEDSIVSLRKEDAALVQVTRLFE